MRRILTVIASGFVLVIAACAAPPASAPPSTVRSVTLFEGARIKLALVEVASKRVAPRRTTNHEGNSDGEGRGEKGRVPLIYSVK